MFNLLILLGVGQVRAQGESNIELATPPPTREKQEKNPAEFIKESSLIFTVKNCKYFYACFRLIEENFT